MYPFKRAFDLLFSTIMLAVVAVPMAVVWLAIRLEDGAPSIFTQRRTGRGGGEFTVYKFRSMRVNAGDVPSALAVKMPITRVGGFIRRWSIDELPQFVNVIKGDMSVVGPRPPLPSQTALIAARARDGVLALRPGITGLAQINGYDGMPDDEKAAYDAAYLRTASLLTDLKIILGTAGYFSKPPPQY